MRKAAPPLHRAVTYEQLYIRCGKPRCRCVAVKGAPVNSRERRVARVLGILHGPYWYAFWRDVKGKMRSRYIGRTLKFLREGDRVPRLEAPNPASDQK